MSDEKRNDKPHPGYNLDELNGIPEEIPLDKALAWEKLYSRLHTNNRRKIRSWYRIAAASILFALLFFAVTGLHKEKGLVNTNIKNKWTVDSAGHQQRNRVLQEKEGQKLSLRISEKEVHLLAGSSNQNSRQSFSKTRQSAKIAGNHQTVMIKNIETLSPPQNQPLPESVSTAGTTLNGHQPLQPPEIQPKIDTVLGKLSTANAKPVVLKKRLRVVHLNELDEPAEATDNLVKNSGRHLFHLKWNEPFASSNIISETTYSHNGPVKISLSSPN